jgi:hypothetical protein
MVVTAFKPGVEITSYTPHWVPLHPTLVRIRATRRSAPSTTSR